MGIGGNFTRLADARREGSYSWNVGGVVEKSSCSVLASLGLNTYTRGKAGRAGTVRGDFCGEVHVKF